MATKKNMTVASRFFIEKKPLATTRVPNPYPNPPPNRTPIGRLCFHGPTWKLDWTFADLAWTIKDGALPDAIFVLDTNFFTKPMDERVWEALLAKHLLITPMVWNELQDWRTTPFYNRPVRDLVLQAEQRQAVETQYVDELLFPVLKNLGTPCCRRIELLALGDDYKAHAYDYYLNLLLLRKYMGPLAAAVLEKKLGRPPTDDEFLKEVQGRFGERGFRIAKKGREEATSPNRFTDEQVVVMAVQTAIMRGSEVYILTRDGDLQEQFLKLVCLMKEHYQAMLAAEQYAARPDSMAFHPSPVAAVNPNSPNEDTTAVPYFEGDSVLVFETSLDQFKVLPQDFHFVNLHCILIGGDNRALKATFTGFCAETEMARLLRIKSSTGGLNTDKFDGRNCIIQTTSLPPEQPCVIVTIGKEKKIKFGPVEVSVEDANNTLGNNEAITRLHYPEE